jgi:hypothetical protein
MSEYYLEDMDFAFITIDLSRKKSATTKEVWDYYRLCSKKEISMTGLRMKNDYLNRATKLDISGTLDKWPPSNRKGFVETDSFDADNFLSMMVNWSLGRDQSDDNLKWNKSLIDNLEENLNRAKPTSFDEVIVIFDEQLKALSGSKMHEYATALKNAVIVAYEKTKDVAEQRFLIDLLKKSSTVLDDLNTKKTLNPLHTPDYMELL